MMSGRGHQRFSIWIFDDLTRDCTGAVFVGHEAKVASGGQVEHVEIGPFLASGIGPERQELLRLIGTLVEEHAHT